MGSPAPPPWRWQADAAVGLTSPGAATAVGIRHSSSPLTGQLFGAAARSTEKPGSNRPQGGAISSATGGAAPQSSALVVSGSGNGIGMGAASAPVSGILPANPTSSVGRQEFNAEDSGSAWKHVKKVIGEDGKSTPDLYNLLAASPLESAYSFHQPGWPSLLKSLSPVMNDFPPLVVERHNTCNMVCFCGAFPSIRRAWATVDNSLFLWRYDRRNDVPVEYSGEEAAIVAVGLVKPQSGVFVEAIQNVLVLCTPVEIVLLGVCCSKGPGGSGDAWHELTLQPLPLYTIPSDNVVMSCVSSTKNGRIFLGGTDGHLYEILYSSSEGWRQKRCSMVCHSGGLTKLLPSLVQSLLMSKLTAIEEIAVDDARGIIYTRSQGTAGTGPCIQVWDIGASGTEAPRWVGKCADIVAEACMHARCGRELFGRTGGTKPGLAYIAPIAPHDSQRLHLIAVLKDGRRVFFYVSDLINGRPSFLKAAFVRSAIPQPTAAMQKRLGATGIDAPARTGMQVTRALYSSGTLLLSEAAGDRQTAKILCVGRDLAAPALTSMNPYMVQPQSLSLRESVVELDDCHVPGETLALVPVPRSSTWSTGLVETLATQHLVPPQRFVLVSTTGVLELEKRRPVDILQAMLEERTTERLELFFKTFGAGEAAAMCLMIIISPMGTVSAAVVESAQHVFQSQHFTGEPGIVENTSSLVGMEPTSGLFNMGRAVLEPQFKSSGAHEGLCLFVSRLVRPMWDKKVLVPEKSGALFMKCPFSPSQLQELEKKLRALQQYLGSYLSQYSRGINRSARTSAHSAWAPVQGGEQWFFSGHGNGAGGDAKRRRLEDAFAMEEKAVRTVRSLVGRTAEALHLLSVLIHHHVGRLVARLPDAMRVQVATMDLREMVCGIRGEEVSSNLIGALVSEHLSVQGGVADDLAAVLGSGCPSYFKEEDRVYYKASGLLSRAANADQSLAKSLTQEALGMLLRVPSSCSLGQVVPQLSSLGCFQGVVDLPLHAAAALDPKNLAARPGAEGEVARIQREACYSHVVAVLKFLVSGNESDKENRMSKQQRAANKKELIKAATRADDGLFLEVFFREMVALDLSSDLLQLDARASASLETYLIKAGGLSSAGPGVSLPAIGGLPLKHLELLARLFISRGKFMEAAQVFSALAERRSEQGDKQVKLEDRLKNYEAALLQAKSQGDNNLVDDLEAKVAIMGFQKRISEKIKTEAVSEAKLSELLRGPKTISELFNDYARPAEMWDICLEIVAFCTQNLEASEIVTSLWDWYLLQGVRTFEDRGISAILEEACKRVEGLGMAFYTNDHAFPMEHVALRLHQIALGTWPEGLSSDQSIPPNGPRRISTAISQAAGNSLHKVKRTYDALLRRREGEAFGRELQGSDLRLQMMQAVLEVATNAKIALREQYDLGSLALSWSKEAREAGQLAEICERYAAQAARLQGVSPSEISSCSSGFKALCSELEGLAAKYRRG